MVFASARSRSISSGEGLGGRPEDEDEECLDGGEVEEEDGVLDEDGVPDDGGESFISFVLGELSEVAGVSLFDDDGVS